MVALRGIKVVYIYGCTNRWKYFSVLASSIEFFTLKRAMSLRLIVTASNILKRLALPIIDGDDSLAGPMNPGGSG